MSTPAFSNHFPPGPTPPSDDRGHQPCPDAKHFDPSYVRETSKNIDIYDKFGRLRYVVELASKLISPGQRGYKVTVAQLLEKEGLKVFLQIPSGDTYEYDYTAAMCNFNACVSKYKSLIDAEMRDFRDIDVYSENIGYEIQHVECCQSCRWCLKTAHPRDDHHCKPDVVKMQCCCPMNEQVFNYAQRFPQMPDHSPFHGWKKLPWQNPHEIGKERLVSDEWDPRKFPNIMFPTVDPLGKCDHYTHGDGYLQYGMPHTPPQYQIASNIATAFDVTATYKPGDLVYYAGKLYQCTVDHTGNWDDTHFAATTINDALQQKPDASILDSYVQNTVLSGYSFSANPKQREIAQAVANLLSVLGAENIGG